jgi:hypothetical protein
MTLLSFWPLLTGTFTAIFAGTGVTMLVMDRMQRITAEFDYQHNQQSGDGPVYDPGVSTTKPIRTTVKASVSNKSRRSIEIIGMRISGLPLEHIPSYSEKMVKKIGSGYQCELEKTVRIDATETVEFTVQIDPKSFSQSASSGMRKPTLRASVIIDCKTRMYPIRSFTAKKIVKAETIMQTDEKAIKS